MMMLFCWVAVVGGAGFVWAGNDKQDCDCACRLMQSSLTESATFLPHDLISKGFLRARAKPPTNKLFLNISSADAR